ncbi:phosphotransferase [Paenibacillus sp. MBLB4367]|uniref:phosphotransferase n=1 Tax=Paenibacillus sp. MBLB4367 TaxID=3384767 RepID=UPI00390806AC
MSAQSITGIANQFGVRVSTQKKIREGIYRIVTPNGITYSLKRMRKRRERLRWIDRTLLRVRRRGILLAWRNPQKPEGQKSYAITQKGEFFILTPWIAGREPSPRSLADMRACGVALARFHKAGRTGVKGSIAYSEIGTWYSTLRSRHHYILKKIAKANRNGFSLPINRILKQHGSEILRYSNQAKALLQSSGYRSYRRNPRKNGVLCHGDGGPSNFIINAKGTYLIDFETLHIDLRAYDLYRVIYNSCKDYKWNFAIAKAILDGYRQVIKLHKNDYKLIRVWLRFPFTSWLVLTPFKRFPLTKKWLQWALASERRVGLFLQKLDKYAAKHSSNIARQ